MLFIAQQAQDHSRRESLENIFEQRNATLVEKVGRTSHNSPDATVKMLISAFLYVDAATSALPSNDLNTDELLTPGQSSD